MWCRHRVERCGIGTCDNMVAFVNNVFWKRTPGKSNATINMCERRPFADYFQGDQYADVVFKGNGEKVKLVDFVNKENQKGKTVVMGWLRHYGCTLCKKQAADWNLLLPRLTHCGPVSVGLIGNGQVEQVDEFRNEMNWNGWLFTDPQRTTYRRMGFEKGVGVTFTARGLGKVINSVKEGNKQSWLRMPTDPFQQGGAVIVDKHGFVCELHRDEYAGDHMDVDKLYQRTCEVCEQQSKIEMI